MTILGIALAGILVVFVAVQLILPRLAEKRVEHELTKHGGHARVHLSALPAPRLLFKEGDSLKVRATGIVTPAANGNGDAGGLTDLDGFDSVDVQVIGLHTGPLTISRLTLRRDRAGPYTATVQATVTGAALASYAGSQIGGGFGGFLGGLAGTAMPGSGTAIPIDLTATLESENGRINATSVNGSVAGVPAGPFVEALAAALATRF